MKPNSDSKRYFTQLFEQYHRDIYAYVYRKIQDDFLAEEIVQNTFIRFWQRQGETPSENPAYFLFFIAKGLLVDTLRKKTVYVSLENAEGSLFSLSDNRVEVNYERQHYEALVKQSVATLPERQRQIFELSYYNDMSHDDIAATLSISSKTVKNLLCKASKRIRLAAAISWIPVVFLFF